MGERSQRRCRALGRRAGWEGHYQLPLASFCPPSACQRPMVCVPCSCHGPSLKHHAHGPSLRQPVTPRGSLLPSPALQSCSEHTMLVGVPAARTQGPPSALPAPKPPHSQLPGEPPAGNRVQGPSPPPCAPAQHPFPQVLRSRLCLSPSSSPAPPGRASTRCSAASPGTMPGPLARTDGVTGTEPSALPERGRILCQASELSAHPASPSTVWHPPC